MTTQGENTVPNGAEAPAAAGNDANSAAAARSASDTTAAPAAIPGRLREYPICRACGSQNVLRDAWARWDRTNGSWEVDATFDNAWCDTCDNETKLTWKAWPATVAERIQVLNDALRQGVPGAGDTFLTAGVRAGSPGFIEKVLAVIRRYDAFGPDNDPHGEHDFGTVFVAGRKLFFKIDCYDRSRTTHSPDASNPRVTRRVLTVMLAEEY